MGSGVGVLDLLAGFRSTLEFFDIRSDMCWSRPRLYRSLLPIDYVTHYLPLETYGMCITKFIFYLFFIFLS